MDKELRILILEDSPADAELEEHELRKAGLVFTSKVVDTREAFLKELEEFFPDLILSDYELPSFDGLAALRIAQEKCPDVPFILVTGKVGEEFVIDKLKDGATDYVLKGNLQRLVPSVKRALKEAEEITERKRLQRELQESEKLYRLLAENTTDMITRHLPDGTYLYVSPACLTLFGYEPEDLIGTNAFAQMHPEDVKRVITITQEAVRKGGSNVSQYRHRTKEGQYIWVETTGKVVKNEITGNIEDIICVVRDITDRKKTEKALEEELIRRRILIDQSRDGIVVLDQDGKVYEANQRFADMLGYSAEEVRQLYVWDWEAQWTREQLLEQVRLVNAAGDYFETCHRRKDGTFYDVEISTNGAEWGEQKLIFCVCRDITNRKKAEESLRNSEAFLNSIITQSPYAIWISDDKGTLIRLNQACRDLLHITDEDVVGKYNVLKDNIVEEQGLMPLVKQVFEQGKTVRFNLEYDSSKLAQLTIKDTIFLVLDVTIFPITNLNGKVTNAVIQHIDITEHKQAETEINKRVRELEDFYHMAVDRELRMKELKREIEELKEELAKYKSNKPIFK